MSAPQSLLNRTPKIPTLEDDPDYLAAMAEVEAFLGAGAVEAEIELALQEVYAGAQEVELSREALDYLKANLSMVPVDLVNWDGVARLCGVPVKVSG